MSIAAETTTDFEDDITVPAGTDMSYNFSVTPLDVTGCTASFISSFGTFPVTFTVDTEGDLSVSAFFVRVPNASLPAPGVYQWRILVTWPLSTPTILQYGHGAVYVKSGY